MKRTINKKLFVGLTAACAIGAFTCFPSYAAYKGAVLSGVKINPLENGYEIVLKSNKNIPVSKHITSNNKIVLDLNDIKPSATINTVYNNTSKVDHVIVQPVANDKIRLFLQGQDMSASTIKIDTSNKPFSVSKEALAAAAAKSAKENKEETLVLNKPISSYKSIATVEDIEADEELEEEVESTAAAGTLLNSLGEKSNLGWLVSMLLLPFVFFNASKLFNRREKKVNINIGGDIKERDLDLYRSLNSKRGLIGSGLGASKPVAPRQKAPGYGSFSQYGLKEYQNSQINPSKAGTGQVDLSSNLSKLKTEAQKHLQNQASLKSNTMPKSSRGLNTPKAKGFSKVGSKDVGQAKSNIDSMKFLESMAKIYEKTGRVDLAHGLQDNMVRSKGLRSA